MFCTSTIALSVVCVQCPIRLIFFCSSLISCFPGMLLRYFLGDFEIIIITRIIITNTTAITTTIPTEIVPMLELTHICDNS